MQHIKIRGEKNVSILKIDVNKPFKYNKFILTIPQNAKSAIDCLVLNIYFQIIVICHSSNIYQLITVQIYIQRIQIS